MRSTSGGFFTTLLMLVPVIVVPALAIFGVPNSDSLKASLESDAAPVASEFEPSLGSTTPPREAVVPESELSDGFLPKGETAPSSSCWADPFHEQERPRAVRAVPNARDLRTAEVSDDASFGDNRGHRVPPERAVNGPKPRSSKTGSRTAVDEQPFGSPPEEAADTESPPRSGPGRRPGPAIVRPRFPEKAVAENAPAAASDWRQAAARLKEFGIKDFQLQPGDGDRQFVFQCRYALPNNPRVVRRFEAESDDPLQAVEQVLSQVEAWAGRN